MTIEINIGEIDRTIKFSLVKDYVDGSIYLRLEDLSGGDNKKEDILRIKTNLTIDIAKTWGDRIHIPKNNLR